MTLEPAAIAELLLQAGPGNRLSEQDCSTTREDLAGPTPAALLS